MKIKVAPFTVNEKSINNGFLLQLCTEGQFKEKMNNLFGHITGDPKTDVTDDDIRSLLFGDYLNKGKDERLYDEIQNLDELREVSLLYTVN